LSRCSLASKADASCTLLVLHCTEVSHRTAALGHEQPICDGRSHVGFSNRPFGVKHFQTVRRRSVDVAHGLALLFGIGTRPFHYGIRRRGGTIFSAALPSDRRRSKPTCELTSSIALAASLIADQVDLVLTLAPSPKKHAAIMAVGKQTLCALMVADHPLAGHKELRLHDCLSYPLALGDATLAGRALIEQALAGASFELDPRLVSNSVEAMKAFVRVNRGVCFQFRKPGNAFVPPGDMIAVPLIDAPLQQARLYLATRRGRVLPVAAAAFVELLRTQLE
jgi:DNA-binding transcriptional LysR family regulator